MFKKLGLKSYKKSKGDIRRTSTSRGAAVPYSPTSLADKRDVTSLLGATSISHDARGDSSLTGSSNGQTQMGPQIPLANAGGTLEEGRLLGEAAGKNDLEGVRVLLKENNIPVNTLDEVIYVSTGNINII